MTAPSKSSPNQSEGELNTSPRRKDWTSRNHDQATRRAIEEDAQYFLRQSVSTPCLTAIAKAEGAYIEDYQGRRYLDFHGNNVHHIGYGHPRLKQAIAKQMDDLPFAPRRFAAEPATAFARKLVEIAPDGLSKVLFTTGGSDAVEVALKASAGSDRKAQDRLLLGLVPWCWHRRIIGRRRAAFSILRRRPSPSRHRACGTLCLLSLSLWLPGS